MSLGIHFTREGNRVLIVEVTGHLDDESGQSLKTKVLDELSDGSSERVLFDLRGLVGCEVLGRARLRELQESLKGRVRRTAYLTATPRMRGMTNIVIHGSEDEHAATFLLRVDADAWLTSSVSRKERHLAIVERYK